MAGRLLSFAEARKRLGLSERTLRRYTAEEKIGHVRFGARVLFAPADLDEFTRRHHREARS